MMSASDDRWLEAMLARVFKVGTLTASAVVGLGLTLQWFVAAPLQGGAASTSGISIVTAGLAIFLLLPCLRVLLMLIVFIRGRDYGFGAVAALVLLIILIAFSIGALAPAKAASGDARSCRPARQLGAHYWQTKRSARMSAATWPASTKMSSTSSLERS